MDKGLYNVILGFAFVLGSCIASFLNVVIWRVPRGESIVKPRSHCPKCNALIRWYQNIPILSWLALRGRCANCREPISPRYILIELLGGVLFAALFWRLHGTFARFGIGPGVLTITCAWIWAALMIVGTFVDFDHKLLPDFVTIGGMVLGVFYNAMATWMGFCVYPTHTLTCVSEYPIVGSLIGLAVGFGVLWIVRVFGSWVFRREAMGMGDVFLLGAIGALCGPVAVLYTLILSSILGSLAGVGIIVFSKKRRGRFLEIPFGPYLIIGCMVWIFRGPEIAAWYVRLFR